MRKIVLLAIVFFLSLSSFTQIVTNNLKCFVIKGNAKNHPQEFWELSISGFIGFERISVPIEKNGSFFKSIAITHPQDIYLDLNEDGIVLFALPGDTLEINWDNKDFKRSFKATSNQSWRQQELDLMMELSDKFRPGVEKLMDELHDKRVSDSTKFERIKRNFINEAAVALSYPQTSNSNKIFGDLYYKHAEYLKRAKLPSTYTLTVLDAIPKTVPENLNLSHISLKAIDETLFFRSDTYRSFIFDKVRFNDAFTIFYKEPTVFASQEPAQKPNYTLKECSAGIATLQLSPVVLDWYLAKAIIFGFERYSFEGAEEAYQTFFPKIKTASFRDTLQQFYANAQRLKPGNKAPALTLKNPEGKNISLDDFKGKVVYIDFWGVYCGACRYDIEKDVPKLHKRYKDKDVVFVNICVDVDEQEWKANLKKLKLDGINLLATGWTNNPVCIEYNVGAAPHYVLIDQKGNLIEPNAPRPYVLLDETENIIDKALKTQ